MAEKKTLTRKQVRLRRKRRRRRILFALEILILLLLVAGLFVFSKMGKMNFAELNFEDLGFNTGVSENKTLKGYTTIALVGLDNREGSLKQGNSDTMIIANINNDTQKVKLMSVYRDTYLRVGTDSEGNGIYNKANSAYNRGGPEQMITMMNTNMDLAIQDFVTVDFNAVAKAAELLGGVDMQLSEEEIVHLNNYCVETSKLTGMDYEPLEKVAGTHHLNGVQTVAYARIRYTAGDDFRRAARQRDVIYKLVEKAKTCGIGTLNKIIDKVFPDIYTSLTKTEIISMAMSMLSYEIEDQAGYPFDHRWGANVEAAIGIDCICPVTLESNAVKVHEFFFPEEEYVPSEELKAYSQRIIDKSGYDDSSRLEISEDGDMESYRQATGIQ
ncbi:MAG: LCP family protein [Oliverpabstia sp.]|nr:LCP family protein [Oliverpabstia sp.]